MFWYASLSVSLPNMYWWISWLATGRSFEECVFIDVTIVFWHFINVCVVLPCDLCDFSEYLCKNSINFQSKDIVPLLHTKWTLFFSTCTRPHKWQESSLQIFLDKSYNKEVSVLNFYKAMKNILPLTIYLCILLLVMVGDLATYTVNIISYLYICNIQ